MNEIDRLRLSLEGLYLGDTFGQKFFGKEEEAVTKIQRRVIPESPWHYTDDTQMALSIFATLKTFGEVKQDYLASHFAELYMRDFRRGYGGSMHDTLKRIYEGESWQEVTTAVFDGMGSYGNGAAMRISLLGAYFADDLPKLVEQAQLSAKVTHAHPEASAGAIGVAIATSLAHQWRQEKRSVDTKAFLSKVAAYIPESEVKARVLKASLFSANTTMTHAIALLGNGVLVSAQDTVPLALWCAAKHLDDFVEALWYTVSALGDRDTTCAMVGGIVACYVGYEGMPQTWLEAREKLPADFYFLN